MSKTTKRISIAVLCFLCLVSTPGVAYVVSYVNYWTAVPRTADWSVPFFSACRPPCWEGIVPGRTSTREAQILLVNVPYILGTHWSVRHPPDPTHLMTEWEGKSDCRGAVVVDTTSGDVVREVTIESVEPKIILGELVDRFGPPDLVFAETVTTTASMSATGRCCAVPRLTLVFRRYAMVAGATRVGSKERPLVPADWLVTPEWVVAQDSLTRIELMDGKWFVPRVAELEALGAKPWPGFGAYEDFR